MRTKLVLGALGLGLALTAATAPEARACGGCFQLPTEDATVITDHRMIFSLSTQQTTLYDQIEYQGSPASFAWVLPIRGKVTVGVSSDALFEAVDQLTQTTIVGPPRPSCAIPDNCNCGVSGSASGDDDSAFAPPEVSVLAHDVVGPYDTVQLRSTDANALNAWLTANSFSIPDSVKPIIASYVLEGFDFLAMRLVPGQDVKAMRPVSVTYPGSGTALPLRMVAAGTGATVGITLWVIGAGRWEPDNFPSFTIDPGELTWDFATSSSNYTLVRSQKEATLSNRAWQIESSVALSRYSVENLLLGSESDYLPVPASDAGAALAPDAVRSADLARVFPAASAFRVTRMRADLAHAALADDLTLKASSDQTELSNTYSVTRGIHAPACPSPPVCPCVGYGGSSSGSSNSDVDAGWDGKHAPAGTGSGLGSAPRSRSTGGCAAAPSGDSGGLGASLALAGVAATAILRGRRRRSNGSGERRGE